ncbi:MAG: sugar phosphate isomerase/epimerase family protein [Lewinella sp.]
MNRRTFIQQAAMVGGAAILPLSCSPESYKMGYQLFSIRDEMAKDPVATLKALKTMGYEDFEVYGFDEEEMSIYGLKPAEFKQVLSDLDLTVTSGHYGFSNHLDSAPDVLKAFVDKCIVCAKALDSKYITWPWIAPEQRTLDNFKRMAPKLNAIGEQVAAAGLGFAYHNHGFEFEDHNGENGFDVIVKETDPDLVKLQLDMYWLMHSSNRTPKELIAAQPGRYVMWHIKDMHKTSRDYTELGNGSIDYKTLLPDPITSGLEYYYLEQGGNYAVDSVTSARESAVYFQEDLQSLI